MSLLFHLLYGVCAQRPGHSLFIAQAQLPLEARMAGIFGGFLAGLGYCLLLGRARALRFPGGAVALALGTFIALMAADGLNALLFDLGQPHLYPPDNGLRFATGLLCGLALAALTLPSAACGLWDEGDWEAPLQSMGELLGAVGVLALCWLLVMADLAALLYPVALLLVGGVVVAFALANTALLGLAHPWRAANRSQAVRPLALALGLALVELLALHLLRAWLFVPLGLDWLA
ncbi:MAG: DUF2085 domain-containing protein [Chloroflexi bacterium]|nr:DUF2085 domain-containing protein [Chloroflexota bacterium]